MPPASTDQAVAVPVPSSLASRRALLQSRADKHRTGQCVITFPSTNISLTLAMKPVLADPEDQLSQQFVCSDAEPLSFSLLEDSGAKNQLLPHRQ